MSITTLVPKQFVLTKSSEPTIDRSTWLSAAKWTTASTPAIASSSVPGSQMFALHERVAGIVVDVAQRGEVPRVGERVVDDDLVVGLAQHVADVVGADEPGAPGDQQLHEVPPPKSASSGASRSLAEICDGSSGSISERPVDAEGGVERRARHPRHPRRPLLVEAVQVLASVLGGGLEPVAHPGGHQYLLPGGQRGRDDGAEAGRRRTEVDVRGEGLAGDDGDELHHVLRVHAAQRALARVGDVDLPPRAEGREPGCAHGRLPVELPDRAAVFGDLLHREEAPGPRSRWGAPTAR